MLDSARRRRLGAAVALLCLQCGLLHRLRVICCELVASQPFFPSSVLGVVGSIWPTVFCGFAGWRELTSDTTERRTKGILGQGGEDIQIEASELLGQTFRFVLASVAQDERPRLLVEHMPDWKDWDNVGTDHFKDDVSTSALELCDLLVNAFITDQQRETEVLYALVLLTRYQGWEWVFNVLIRDKLWSCMSQAASPAVLARLLRFIGLLVQRLLPWNDINADPTQCKAIDSSLTMLNVQLAMFMDPPERFSRGKQFPLLVQVAAASTLVRLRPNNDIQAKIVRWFDELEPEQRISLQKFFSLRLTQFGAAE